MVHLPVAKSEGKEKMYIVRTLARRLRTLRGMTIVHVGANRGQEADLYQKWGARRVVWIEADPSIIPALQQHLSEVSKRPASLFCRLFRAPKTEHILISALVGEIEGANSPFYLFSNGGESNSIFRLSQSGQDKFPHIAETGEVLQMKMRSLDVLLVENGIDPVAVDVLALDIQGAELLCLKGATKLLSTLKYLETEISKLPFYEGGVLLPELELWLNARGFYLKTWLRRPSMNAVFVKR
jgi:FkbM family methyltransferase